MAAAGGSGDEIVVTATRQVEFSQTTTGTSIDVSELAEREPIARNVTGLILLVPAVLTLVSDEAAWGVFDFVFAGVLIAGSGLLLEFAARNPGNLALKVVAAAIGVAAIALGEADDAPGLVLFGLLLIVGTVALTVRTLRSH